MALFRYLLAFSSICIFLSGCKSDEGDPSTEDNAKDRQEILIHWVDRIIKPSYVNFKIKFDALTEATDAFTAAPDNASLGALRTAWEEAYVEWQNVELFEFGPADTYTLRSFFNIYPTDVNAITTNMNDPTVSLDVPSAYASQGFPALDYLITGIAGSDEAIVIAYTTDPEAAKRIAYLKRLVTRMNSLVNNVISEWNGGYREIFISRTGLDIGSSMGNVVNAYVLEYERYIRSGKVAIPAGVFSSNIIQPDKVEALYKKDLSKILAQTAQKAAKDFFNGTSKVDGSAGPSFKTYLDALEAKDPNTGTLLSTAINDQFTEIDAKLAQLGPNFNEQVHNGNEAMLDTFTSMQKLVRLLKLDMTSAMSITITYTDNDGD